MFSNDDAFLTVAKKSDCLVSRSKLHVHNSFYEICMEKKSNLNVITVHAGSKVIRKLRSVTILESPYNYNATKIALNYVLAV